METQATAPEKTYHLATCAKCDGNGTILAFSHISNGRCFWCGGSGKVDVDAYTDSDLLRQIKNRAGYDAEQMILVFKAGREDLLAHYASRIATELHKVGTANAREVLAHLAAGRAFDDDRQRWAQIDRADALHLRSMVIAAGR